jgi:serine/threonine-protein kinase RsbW
MADARQRSSSAADTGLSKPATPPETLRLHVTSDTANLAPVRKAVEAYTAAAGFDDAAVAEIGLVVNEALANVIRHAYDSAPGKPIDIEADPLTDHPDCLPGHDATLALRIRIRDWGSGQDPTRKRVRGYVPGEPGGLGLVCLGQMMDEVRYTPQPDGMLLTMVKRKRPADGDAASTGQ